LATALVTTCSVPPVGTSGMVMRRSPAGESIVVGLNVFEKDAREGGG
jgi:hypothetical protein